MPAQYISAKLVKIVFTVPNPLRNQTQYVRFSSSPNGIFASQSIQAALRTVENVVYTCYM